MADIHRIVMAIGEDPQLVDELITACDPITRRNILHRRGLLIPGEPGPTQDELEQDIYWLLAPGSPMIGSLPPNFRGEAPVEWVAAIASAAAGAASGACTADS